MQEEITTVKTGQVTYAVRDTIIDEKEIHQGDYMGIGDAGILAVGRDMDAVIKEMVEQMVEEDTSVLTIYYGAEAEKEKADALAETFEALYPDCEVECYAGGQPIYYYIISAE